jgi:anti-sigma-K factor RskA
MAVMSNGDHDKLSENEEIEALMPWYVSGKLDANSRAQVERYLEAHPERRTHLALVREESGATLVANESIAPPSAEALDRLRASIGAVPRRQSLWAQFSEHLANWVSDLAPSQLVLATAAAAVVVMLQAAVIGALIMERSEAPNYQTASGEQTSSNGVELLVGFAETATAGEISALLDQLDAVVVDGPRAGLYRLRLPEQGEEENIAAIELLDESEAVRVVLPQR